MLNLTPALLIVAKTAYQCDVSAFDFTVMSINLADELVNKQLVIMLIFVNNEHVVNAVTMGKVSHVDKMRMQTMREQGIEAKAIIRAYTRINNGN